MRFLLLAVVLLAIPASAQAPDTLDWRRYYPLAVGNVWEYHDAEAWGVQFRHTLVADTVVGGRTYFVRRTDQSSLGSPTMPATPLVDYVRYEEGGGGVVAAASLDGPPASVQPCSATDLFERDLRLGFGTRLPCPASADSVVVAGQYGAVWQPDVLSGPATPIDVAAIKQFTVGYVHFTTFVADIGPVRAGNLWGPSLHYARVGGVEYGTPEMTVAEPGGPLTVTDGVAAPSTDYRIELANLTTEPVALDSLVMRFSEEWGLSTWRVETYDPPYVFCHFAPFEPDWMRCAPGVTFAPGTVVRLDVGYDPCAVCRGGAPDTLLVYSGGVAEPDTVLFDDSGYVDTDDGPTLDALALAVSPNPSRGAATVTLTGAVPLASARVTLVDALGRRVAVLHDGPLPADARLALPPGLPAGVYTVSVDADGQAVTARITVVR